MNENTENTDLQITVEMSDDFEPGPRTAAALNELVHAVHEEHGEDDVSGFSQEHGMRSFTLAIGPSNFFEALPVKMEVDGSGTSFKSVSGME